MQNDHLYGSPLTVLNFNESSENPLVKEQLANIFNHPDVKANNLAVFSVVGPYRKGKSFFLNYCLRFLYAHYPSINFPDNPLSNPDGWLGTEDEPLFGFSWRSGSDPDTKGIVMWNDVFIDTNEKGEKVGIILIDSQGLFNSESSQIDDLRIFVLGTLISSIQVFNLSGVVQEDQLQYLQFAAEYAKFALNNNEIADDEKPFQKLLFLIRDWDNPQEYLFGCVGGEKYLQKFFDSKSKKTDELKSVYEYINNLYQDFSCSLLPNPGKIVSQGINKAQNQKYDGCLAGMDEDFREELAKIIEQTLSPKNLILKKCNGKYLTGAEFLDHMQQYFNFYLTNKLPDVQTVLESIVDNEMKALMSLCVDKYKEDLKKDPKSLTSLENIQNCHESCKATILIFFKDSIKIGEPEDELKYKQQLIEKLDNICQENVKKFEENEKKIKEEKNKIRIEMEMKHKQELEDMRRQIDADKMKKELELQIMRDEYEEKKNLIENEVENLKKQKSNRNYDGDIAGDKSMNFADDTKCLTVIPQLRMDRNSDSPINMHKTSPSYPKFGHNQQYPENIISRQNIQNNYPHYSLSTANQQNQQFYSQKAYNNNFEFINQHQAGSARPSTYDDTSDKYFSNKNNPFKSNQMPSCSVMHDYPQSSIDDQNQQFEQNQWTQRYTNPRQYPKSQDFPNHHNLYPRHRQSTNPFIYDADSDYDQQTDEIFYDANNFIAPGNENGNFCHQSYEECKIGQDPLNYNQPHGIRRNYEVSHAQSQNKYENKYQSHTQVYPKNTNQFQKMSSTMNKIVPNRRDNYSQINNFQNSSNYSSSKKQQKFIQMSLKNERDLQEGEKRLAKLRAEFSENAQKKNEEEELKLVAVKKQNSKENKGIWSWMKSKMPKTLIIWHTTYDDSSDQLNGSVNDSRSNTPKTSQNLTIAPYQNPSNHQLDRWEPKDKTQYYGSSNY